MSNLLSYKALWVALASWGGFILGVLGMVVLTFYRNRFKALAEMNFAAQYDPSPVIAYVFVGFFTAAVTGFVTYRLL